MVNTELICSPILISNICIYIMAAFRVFKMTVCINWGTVTGNFHPRVSYKCWCVFHYSFSFGSISHDWLRLWLILHYQPNIFALNHTHRYDIIFIYMDCNDTFPYLTFQVEYIAIPERSLSHVPTSWHYKWDWISCVALKIQLPAVTRTLTA